jgi:diguanylate cyclase (GGDEF)-like protein/PAS domain S-box-containing protein
MKKITFKFHRWLFYPTQCQMALTFGTVLLLIMLVTLLKQQQHFLDNANILRANAIAKGLAYSSSSSVLANDGISLRRILQDYVNTQNVDHAFVVSKQGEVLASTQPKDVGLFVSDSIKSPSPQVLVANSDMIDIAMPIIVDKQPIGWIRVELNQQTTRANLRSALLTSLAFIAINALILLTISTLLAKGMSSRLQQLISVARKIINGERSVRADIQHHDELGDLAVNINQMLDILTDSEQRLDDLHHVYSAWKESVTTIFRETNELALLNSICNILVEKMTLHLVFIGLIDDNNWICPVASSDWQSSYFANLNISANPLLPEGQEPLGLAIHERTAQIFNDFLSHSDTVLWHELARAESIRSVAAFPLIRAGKVVGGISVYSQEINYFSTDIITLLNGLAVDISFALDNFDHEQQRRQTETELALAASVFENSQEGILITNPDKIIIRVNNAFSLLTGYKAEEVIGKVPQILSSEQYNEIFYQFMWEQINAHGYWQGEITNCRKDGSSYLEWLTIIRVTNKSGETTHYVGIFVDITDRKLNEDYIHKLAFYDSLTQLPNRRLFVDRLGLALHSSQHNQYYGALMFIDIDRFKVLNDTQGHDIGDQLLVEVSKRLTHCVREQDTVVRLGGDEFVIMLEHLSEDATEATLFAQRVGNKVLHTLSQPYLLRHFDMQGQSLSSVEHHSSASIGMKLFQGTDKGDDLLKQADMAMYQAKQSGRNTLCIFDPDMQTKLTQRAVLEADMSLALQNNQFHLHYQVQVDAEGQATGAEVLLRWHHPLRGNIPPVEFIPLAEESGLIAVLGLWVLNKSCQTLAVWAEQPETQRLTLAVNVSAKQFNRDTFVDEIKGIINKNCINPQRLKLEITESIIMEDVEQTIKIMNALRELGISFSMDDFGTGYSSLSYLQRLPLSQLKIDQSFLRNLTVDSTDTVIIRTILALGNSLGINVIAEGVETQQQRDYLLNNGCQFFQGYLFGKPESISLFEQRFSS